MILYLPGLHLRDYDVVLFLVTVYFYLCIRKVRYDGINFQAVIQIL